MSATQRTRCAHALPLFLLAGLCLSALDATAKYLVRDHSLFLVVWARYAGQMLVVTPFAWHRAGPAFWRTRKLPLQLAALGVPAAARRSASSAGCATCRSPRRRRSRSSRRSSSSCCRGRCWASAPTRARWIASVAGFVGILILLRPGSAVLHPAVLLLIGAAIVQRALPAADAQAARRSAHTTLFYSAIVGTVGLSLALPFALDACRISTARALLLFLLSDSSRGSATGA